MNNTYTFTKVKSSVIVGNRAKDLVAFGRSQGWNFPVLGNAPLPSKPVHINGWLIVPAHLDSTPLPKQAQIKMNAIYGAGIRPQGWLMIHEAPKQIPAQVLSPEDRNTKLVSPYNQQKAKELLKTTGTVLGTVALASGTFVLAIAAIAMILPVLMIASAVLVDPILVAFTDDGYWVEIDRWDI